MILRMDAQRGIYEYCEFNIAKFDIANTTQNSTTALAATPAFRFNRIAARVVVVLSGS
jgi:hypothetical protein